MLLHTLNADGLNQTPVSGAAPLPVTATGTLAPAGAVTVRDHANVAANTAALSLPATAGVTNYLTGVDITGGGATAASLIVATVSNLQGGVLQYAIAVPAGATAGIVPIVARFNPPIPATGPNVAITLSVPSFGTGNTNAVVGLHGYQV